jgi:UDP-GlcNAc3NAcA epimerase
MKKIVTVIGARPQFVKAAVVSRAIKKNDYSFEEVIVHTGQHFDKTMSEVFFEELSIPHPKYNLGVGGGTHGQNTGRMIEKLEEVYITEKPDLILVYGDTDSTLSAALAAVKLHIPIAHVEAGLRSFNREMPEEINRILTDHISTYHFVPTEIGASNLDNEGIKGENVQLVGDVMKDAAVFYQSKAIAPKFATEHDLVINKYVLCTIHRAENVDNENNLIAILEGLGDSEKLIILPLHPRTKNKILAEGIKVPNNVVIVDPVSYLEMVWLEMNCSLVVTDSGGVQKEAYFHKKPCITVRNETEWLELVENNLNILVGSDKSKLAAALLQDWDSAKFENTILYGNGESARLILDHLSKKLC